MQPTLENITNPDCPFCKIVRSETQSYNIFEDDNTLAFLDKRPVFPGHCLLIPKSHYETLIDLPASLVAPLFQNAQLLARAMEQGLQAEGTFVAINNRISQSVPHVHIHIVPRHKKDGLERVLLASPTLPGRSCHPEYPEHSSDLQLLNLYRKLGS